MMRCLYPILVLTCLSLIVPGISGVGAESTDFIVGWGGQVVVGQSALEDLVAIAGGAVHSLGLRSDGTIVAWGRSREHECEIPAPNEDFAAVAAGAFHNLGLQSDGTIVAWGHRQQGQCDVPAPNAHFVAVAVPAPDPHFVAVAAGAWHSLGFMSDGTIVTWGDNFYGQRDVPAPNTDFVATAARWFHNLGLKANGTLTAWGWNSYDACNVPPPNEGFVGIAAGLYHSLGVKGRAIDARPDPVPLSLHGSGGEPCALRVSPAASVEAACLSAPHPTPFRYTTSLSFGLPQNEVVSLRIYDVAGRLVRTLIDGTRPAGHHAAIWNARSDAGAKVMPGVYFVRFDAGELHASRRIVLL